MSRKLSLAVAAICLAALPVLAETSPTPGAAPAAATATPGASPTTPPAGTTAAAPGHGKRWQACAADVQKFCADAEKGRGMIRACLTSHAAELSDGCKAGMAAHSAEHAGKAPETKTP
jgi:Cysteine rich repeat